MNDTQRNPAGGTGIKVTQNRALQWRLSIVMLLLMLTPLLPAGAAEAANGAGGSPAGLGSWTRLGTVKPRPASEIKSSNWSVGGETTDRDFTIYANYKKYLGPLGAKAIRVQAGWAKCEKQRGVYDWAWLDEIVNDAVAQGVQPWLETSYGNPAYPQGGGTGLGGGFPKSAEAFEGWDKWVRALVHRYKDRVTEWEIWNEPDGGKGNTPEAYASLFIRTAEIIRAEQPESKIYALALAGRNKFGEEFLKQVQAQGKLNLVTAVVVHGYPKNPDDTGAVESMRKIVEKYSPSITVRQGESGAPSKFQPAFALANQPWSETTQAKWDLRRMLAHLGIDSPYNLFTMMDMHYVRDGKLVMNWKGLLESKPDQTVDHVKPAYYAAQRVCAIFDDSLERIRDFRCEPQGKDFAAYGYRQKGSGAALAAVWSKAGKPVDANDTTPMDLAFTGMKFTQPVYVDLLTGAVYEIPKTAWSPQGEGSAFKGVPVYDSPVLIAERSLIQIQAGGAQGAEGGRK